MTQRLSTDLCSVALRQAKRVVLVDRHRVEVKTVELPQPQDDEVVLKIHYSTISPGTELAFLHGLANTTQSWPTISGYSACGEVLACGSDVQNVGVGDLVVANAAHASGAVLAAVGCFKIPDTLAAMQASAYHLASIALQGVSKAQVQLGQTVALIGLGMIGNLAGQLCRAAGATFVVGIDPVDWRRELAMQCGFDAVFESCDIARNQRRDLCFDIVVEATGAPDPINHAFALAANRGRVILLGSTRGETEQVNFYRDVHKKGLTVIGAHALIRAATQDVGFFCTHETDNRTVLDLMVTRRISIKPLLSDMVSGNDAASAYERLSSHHEPLMTIVLDWRQI